MIIDKRRILSLFALIFAGEIIFSLPFHIIRFFRPTVLQVFDITNAELGDVFAVYGITAMLAYFPGGAIADRFSARALISFSLLSTAAGGIYLASVPSVNGLKILFAYWGLTTILLFWSALIKATRQWGDINTQGKAFGLLDGGRGLIAAGVASVAVIILYAGVSQAAVQHNALVHIIYFYSAVTALSALFIWLFLHQDEKESVTSSSAFSFSILLQVVKTPIVWIQAGVIVCAYCGYKGLDYYTIYAVDVLGMSDLDASRFTTYAAYLRPVAAVCAGILADRFLPSKVITASFVLVCLSYLFLGFSNLSTVGTAVIMCNLLVTVTAVFALRGIYFALLEETGVANSLSGRSVGLISVVGFTPDIFFAPISGRLIDASSGVVGYQHFFLLLAFLAIVGILMSFMVMQKQKSR